MADYRCILDLWYDRERFRRWDCRKAEIFHYMPDRFIDLMNDWSRQSVSAFEDTKYKDTRRKKTYDEEETKRFCEEEAILSIYR